MKENTYKVSNIYSKICRKEQRSPLTVSVPGSKSLTNRALLLATLANGTSTLRGVLFSDDSRHFLKCVQDLGFETEVDEDAKTVKVTGLGGAVPKAEASQYVGSAGTEGCQLCHGLQRAQRPGALSSRAVVSCLGLARARLWGVGSIHSINTKSHLLPPRVSPDPGITQHRVPLE